MRSLITTFLQFSAECNGERILKISQHFAKLSAKVECPLLESFLTPGVVKMMMV